MHPIANNNKMKDICKLLILYSILLISAALLFSCNPVKQVIKDKRKLDEVAEVVIRSGYCANDTLIITKSDTTIKYDTAFVKEIKTEVKNDTVYFWEQHYNTIQKRIYIRDTIKNVILDNAQIDALKGDINVLNNRLAEEKEKSKKRFKYLFLLSVLIGLYILYKFKNFFIR